MSVNSFYSSYSLMIFCLALSLDFVESTYDVLEWSR